VHRTYSKFPYVETWNGLAADLLLVASREPPVHDVQALRARQTEPTYARAMRGAWFSAGLEGCCWRTTSPIGPARAAFTAVQGELSTDDLSPIEFGFGREVSGSFVPAETVLAAACSRGLQRPRLKGRSRLRARRLRAPAGADRDRA
jgi:hypothetical protein